VRAVSISKTFAGTRALDDVSLEIQPGMVHALLGGNGSGKSTLIKILAGVYHADPGGTITVGDHEIDADKTTPSWAKSAGLHFVHQDPGVFADLTVAENVAIGHGFETGPIGNVRWRAVRRRTQVLLERFEIPATPDTPVGLLRPADRTMVAIARALQDQEGMHEGVLVLDEPTTALPAREVEALLARLRRYADAGQTIVYVTHRLDEVFKIADRVTVLRDGRHAATVDVVGLDESGLVELIVGRPLDQVFPEAPPVKSEDAVLEVRDLVVGPLTGISFKLRYGEILGIAGLLGSGRSELLKTIFGSYVPAAGEILLEGKPLPRGDVSAAMNAGIAYVPEDRLAEGAFLDMSLRENISAAEVRRYWSKLRFLHRREGADARRSIEEFSIRARSDRQPFLTLSGGNQQKVVLGRWLRRGPKVLLLDEPTQGVDVGTRGDLYGLVASAVTGGAAAVVVTSDFEELSRVSDRVLVLAGGRIAGELVGDDINAHRLTELSFSRTAPRPALTEVRDA